MTTFDKLECIRSCPRFDRCGAAVCPLDPDCLSGKHLDVDRACIYLREAAKHGGKLPDDVDLTSDQVETVNTNYQAIKDKFGILRRSLERSAKTGSRLKTNPRCQKAA